MEGKWKNVASATKGLFLLEQKHLKNFTIPKRIPDKGLLKECSIQQRDYSEIKQLLSHSCLDMKYNFENFWQIEKVQIVQNRYLEEDFIAKRAKLREEGRPDKELSCFLVVPKEEVSNICQGSLHIGHSKEELNVTKQLGNPQLGVYLFRYVDIALRYASNRSFPIENIIIFRVLLGKVKKVQPPKGKKKVALDPTPNYDCHISRIHPSVKDSLEEQTIGSLVYFYEYNELSKPVDKPRQCLPHAVIKIKSINQKIGAGSLVQSLKCKPKRLPNNVGRSLPLENCTRVTRIGKSQLIYEHFRKPVDTCAENAENNASAEVSPFSGDAHNWSSSVAESQGRKMNYDSTRKWDATNVKIDKPALQYVSPMDVCRDIRSKHMGSKTHSGISPIYDSALSTVITSKVIKDPRLTKREQILGKQNGEAGFSGISHHENELEYNLEMKLSATIGVPNTVPEDSFLFNSKNMFSQRCYTDKTWNQNITEEGVSPYLLSGDQGLGIVNKEILSSQNTRTDHALETYLALGLLKSKEFSNNPHRVMVDNSKGEKGMTYSEVTSSQLNSSKTVDDKWKCQDSHPINKKHVIIKPLSCEVTNICISKQNPINETFETDEMADRKEMTSQLEDDDIYTSGVQCTTDNGTKCVRSNCTSSGEHIGEIHTLQNPTLQLGICESIVSENVVKEVWDENNFICQWPSNEISAEQFEQNKFPTAVESENSNMSETQRSIKQMYSTYERAKESISIREVCTINDIKEISAEESTSNKVYAGSSDSNSDLLNSNLSQQGNVPEMFEEVIEVKCGDINTQDLKIPNEVEKVLGKCTKCLSVPHKPCNHGNMTNEKDAYYYLLERMDWDTLLRKASQNTEISGNPSMNENENNYLYSAHSSVVGKSPELVFPDLQITVTNSSQSELKLEIGKRSNKCPRQRSGTKWLGKKMMKKYTQSKNKHNLYNGKKELKCCSSKMFFSLSKGRLTKIAQSEKHIKNILNTLNTEASLCKNKLISQKIDRVMFHLRKAQRRVQSLKNVTNAGRGNSGDSSKTHEVLPCESSPVDFSVTPGSFLDMSCSSASVRNMTITEMERVSETSTNLDTMQLGNIILTSADEHSMINEQSNYENCIKENVTTTMESTKENSNSEASSCASENIAKCLNSAPEPKKLVVHQADEGTCKSDVKMSTVTFVTSLQTTVKASAEANALQSDDDSMILENDFSNEDGILEVSPAQKNNERVSSSGYVLPPMPLVDNGLLLLSHNIVLPEHEGKKVGESEVLEIKEKNSNLKPHIMNDISLKPFISLEQKETSHAGHITPPKESASKQISSKSTRLYSNSPLSIVSEHNIETINANFTLSIASCDIKQNETNQHCIFPGTRMTENPFSGGYSNNYIDHSCDIKCTQIEIELKCSDFKIKMSEVLQKADETSSSNFLHDQIIFCRYFLPLFIKAFEKKQGCCFECVLVSRAILESVEENMPLSCKLKPSAIESLVELQIIMETIEFLENKKRFIEGEPTFRSLLWYDDSLCNELFGDQSGYQQQSNFYPAFQRRLKYSALSELQSYHEQLVDIFENTRWENSSYYTFLKSRREIKECEAAMTSDFNATDFFLSVPYVCGANYGDTLEDLEDIRKTTMNLLNLSRSLPRINLNAEKEDHFWVIVEIIATKVEFIKTCEEMNIKTSLFGLEHIFFDAAKSLVWRERTKSLKEHLKGGQMSNETVLSKCCETYEHMIEFITKRSAEECYISEKGNGQQKASPYTRDSLILPQDICCIGEILDEAQSANTERLQQLMFRCTEHMEMLKKYFQILQEEDVSVLITKENVLGFMKDGGINPLILKPEAVEVYTEMAMTYETVFFLKNSIASKENQPRFRSLLWFDLSLLPELFRSQEKMASLSYRKDNLSKIIESAISELQDELNVIYEYPENVNCPYARHLLTRELTELSETRNLLKTSKTPISMCVDLVPYTVCLNYGSTVSELECNYNQFSSLLEKLMLAERKDLGKMAHIMKIMKTIEHMRFICSEQRKSPLPLVIHQMLKNWRKACQLKRQNVKADLNVSEGYDNKDTGSLRSSHALYKRPVDVISEDAEKRDQSQRKKKKKSTMSIIHQNEEISE
ncbi:testis-expressed protein 15 isoform X1 [Pogona vitticeps]